MTYLTNATTHNRSTSIGAWKRDPLGVFWLQFRNFFTLDSDHVFSFFPHDEMRQRLTNDDDPPHTDSAQTEGLEEEEIITDAEPRPVAPTEESEASKPDDKGSVVKVSSVSYYLRYLRLLISQNENIFLPVSTEKSDIVIFPDIVICPMTLIKVSS